MTMALSFCGLCGLLLLGKLLRTRIALLQRLYLPASLIGGVLGLVVLTAGRQAWGADWGAEWTAGWGAVPAFLINVVFAGLFLGAASPSLATAWKVGASQLCFGQMLAWGQYVVGLALAGFVLVPRFRLPAIAGNLIEIGFEGGHGTVAGMKPLFEQYGWLSGWDLGITIATCGMIFGVVVGMILINWAARAGHIARAVGFEDRTEAERRGIFLPGEQPAAGRQTVSSDSVDSLAFHIALIGLSILVGVGLKGLLVGLDGVLPARLREIGLLKGMPLFPLCMFGGIVVQRVFHAVDAGAMINRGQIQRLSGASLDFLIVAAAATINLRVVSANWAPLLLLVAGGAAWCILVVRYAGPRLFTSAWFERAIAEFGQSTGVTATGLMLLRTVDPEAETGASEAFGYKQLLHEPIMGGGLWTSMAVPLVVTFGWKPILVFSLVMLVFWSLFGTALARRERLRKPDGNAG